MTVPSIMESLCIAQWDLVKMDIEGAEAHAMAGKQGQQWLRKTRFFYAEVHPNMEYESLRVALQAMFDAEMQVRSDAVGSAPTARALTTRSALLIHAKCAHLSIMNLLVWHAVCACMREAPCRASACQVFTFPLLEHPALRGRREYIYFACSGIVGRDVSQQMSQRGLRTTASWPRPFLIAPASPRPRP